MKFFKKIKDFFIMDNRYEEDEYDEDYFEDDIEQDDERSKPKRVRSTAQTVERKESSKFRFPLIDDEEEVLDREVEEPIKEKRKSAVFYDVEQNNGVKLPSHLPQQSLVYDVEVSNIAELLAKRNKTHGNRSIVRYDQSPVRPRTKGPVTSAERQYLTANPQREDVANPVVNREPTTMKKGKRFVPTQVPSPVHGFNKPKSIEELIPNLEEKQQEAKISVAQQDQLNNEDSLKRQDQVEIQSLSVEQVIDTKQNDSQLKETVKEQNRNETQLNPLAQEKNEFLQDKQVVSSDMDVAHQHCEVAASLIEETVEVNEDVASEVAVQAEEALVSGQTNMQDLSVQHLTIENSTVHIEQLKVEQSSSEVQPTVKIESMQANSDVSLSGEAQSQSTSEQSDITDSVMDVGIEERAQSTNESKGTRLPFNVIMLDSDKKKLKAPLSNTGTNESERTISIIDWKGNVISTPMTSQEVQQEIQEPEQIEVFDTTEQDRNGGSPFLGEPEMPEQVQMLVDIAMNEQEGQAQEQSQALEKAPEDSEAVTKQPDEHDLVQGEKSNEEYNEDNSVHSVIQQQSKDSNFVVEQSDETESMQEEIPSIRTNASLEEPVHKSVVPIEIQETIQDEKQDFHASNLNHSEVPEAAVVEQPSLQVDQILEAASTQINIKENKPVVNMTTSTEPQQQVEQVLEEVTFVPYEKPPTDFLLPAEERTEDWAWLDEQAEYLIAALASHQVQAQIESIEQGPAVTQFEITVAQGTKVSKVRNLSDDIKLALAAKDIRIDAPIPGKRTIGIEIPNRVSRAVRLSEVTNSERFQESESPLEAALGLDLSGKPVTLDLRKMPHGLIAGATGSGKSVCINSILVSLLYKADPNELKLMLIDPKMVELAPFNKIPHLVSPVITDVKAATAALKWAVDEMERRYQLFMHAGVRDLPRYNQQAENAKQYAQKLPYILIVIDELADLMMMSPADVEEAICRIAQKARACGIHLIVATQRPSVDVITGLIKSNIPTRIAFAVSSAVDSRTILDMQGAERLLGRGDMLYLGNGMQAPIRLQGTFVTDDEIEDIIAYVRNQGEPNYLFAQEDLIKRTEMFEEQDELFEEVCRFVYEQGTASTSSVQRHFHIGYNRAARLVDMLEKKGFVSEARGSKPRDVFINESDLDELFS